MADTTTSAPANSPRSTVTGGAGQADAGSNSKAEEINKNFDEKSPPGHDDSVLESIGKAITEPMRDAADEGEGAPTPP